MAQRLMESEARERNFLMSVSHELRTPLTAIRGHVSALAEGLVDDPEGRARSLAIVEAEAGRLERLVGDILDLAKLDAHRFTVLREEVGMEQLVERAYDTFAEQARARSIDFSVDVKARPVIVSDGDRVLQIVDNLLSNAFRATPDGGRIALELGQSNGRGSQHRARRGRGQRPGHRARTTRSGCSGRSSRARAAPGSASRSRGSSRTRSAGRSSSHRSPARARGSSWYCRPTPRWIAERRSGTTSASARATPRCGRAARSGPSTGP